MAYRTYRNATEPHQSVEYLCQGRIEDILYVPNARARSTTNFNCYCSTNSKHTVAALLIPSVKRFAEVRVGYGTQVLRAAGKQCFAACLLYLLKARAKGVLW